MRSGSVALSRRKGEHDTVVGYCAANSFLDALGCLSAETTRSLNAKAMVATEALSIDHSSFKALLKADARLAAKMDAERTEQLTQYAHMQARPKAGSVFDYLMSHGLERPPASSLSMRLCAWAATSVRRPAPRLMRVYRDSTGAPGLRCIHCICRLPAATASIRTACAIARPRQSIAFPTARSHR